MHRRRGSWSGYPPFGLRRRVFWSLLGSMVVAGMLTRVLFAFWSPGSTAVGVFFLLVFLWIASGRLSHRLVRPVDHLVAVVQRIGQGDLSARASVPHRRRDEVARVARAIDDMAERIQHQMQEEKQLLAVVSHELRTPLARIRVLTELARDGNSGALSDIDREVGEIDALVSDILARSRLEFGTLAPRLVDLVEVVRESLERSNQPLHLLDAPDDVPLVTGDPTLLYRAVANLLDNARKHGSGIVRVSVSEAEDGVRVEVVDAGPGFGEPGNRGNGLGLGLTLVRRIVDAHHGRLWTENLTPRGAKAGFAIPLSPPAPPSADTPG